jgi:cell shape-determining protein MreC
MTPEEAKDAELGQKFRKRLPEILTCLTRLQEFDRKNQQWSVLADALKRELEPEVPAPVVTVQGTLFGGG